MSKPKNWPEALPYLRSPLLDKTLGTSQMQLLKKKPSPTTTAAATTTTESSPHLSSPVPTVPTASCQSPSPLVKIQPIHDANHPANGQYGLFAARDLKPGTFIIPYLGRVHPGTAEATDPNSDYDLWLDHDADLAVDASKQGNEARFVNDYRGVREKPNAEFGTAWCERWGQLCVGFWVLDAGKAKAKASGKAKVDKARQQGIKKGEEILVSYGKGFWGERMDSTQEEGITE